MLPKPFIAHFKTNSGSFVTVTELNDQSVTYLQEDESVKKIELNDFLRRWSGTVLLAEPPPEARQQKYKEAERKEITTSLRLPLLILGLMGCGIIQLVQTAAQFRKAAALSFYLSFWCCSLAGVIISAFLVWYDFDKNNTYLKKLCSINKKTNCSAVLNSEGSKIFGFSWAEIGMFYFLGTFIYLVVNNTLSVVYPLITLNFIALPYILFSVYYQAVFVKHRCTLCLAVQTVLLSQFFAIIFAERPTTGLFWKLQHVVYSQLLLAYIIPFAIWSIIKQRIFSVKEDENTKYSFKRFKNNFEVFAGVLQKQPPVQNNPNGLGITLGNPNAQNILIKVCSE